MKKGYKWAIGVVGTVVVIGAAYHLANMPPSEELPLEEQVMSIMRSGGCIDCHSFEGEMPFYGNWPLVGRMIKRDMAEGYKYFDITPVYSVLAEGGVPPEVDLAKIEMVAANGSMPMPRYAVMHWGSALSHKKKAVIKEWVDLTRFTSFYNGLSADEFKYEPVYPVVDVISTDARKVELGNILFHDTRLSTDNTISCASCHDLETAGVDNERYSDGVQGQLGGVNAPTVYNAVFNFAQFWDGRAHDLAMQAAGPPLNPVEMASVSWEEITGKLNADKELKAMFVEVYPEGFTEATITDAIQEFEKTLITPNSAFDRYLKGDKDAISEQAKRGYKLFKDNNCAACHVGVNFGGQSYELMGLKRDYFADRGMELTEEDNGRFKQTKTERDRHRFKVPGLRNVVLTWPYFHDGTVATIQEAVNHMNRYQVGNKLSAEDTDDIVVFLETLTGEYNGVKLTNKNVQEK